MMNSEWGREQGGDYSPSAIYCSPPAAFVFGLAVDGEVGVGVEARLVQFRHLGGVGLRQLAALNALRDDAAEPLVELAALVARAVERLADGRALNDLLNQVAVLVDVDVRLVRRAEEVVVVAHHFLVGADQHEGDVVGLVLDERVQLQHLLHVVEVDELVHDAVRVARDVAERGVLRRRLVQAVDRDDGEELVERPVVGHRAEDGEVRQVLGAQQAPQLGELFGDVLGHLRVLVGTLAHVPEQDFALGAVFQRDKPEVEEREQLVPVFERVVVVLAVVLDRDRLAQVGQLDDDLRVVVVHLDGRDVLDDRLYLREDVGDEDGVVGRKIPARLLDDGRVRDVLVVADLHDGVDDVVGELLRRVVGRRVEGRLRAVVVNGHPAADVEEVNGHLHLDDLGVDARGLLHRVLDALDVCELRADVEVQELEHVDAPRLLHAADGLQNLGRREPELRRLAARLLPPPRALRVELDAEAEHRQVAALEAVGHREHVVELVQLLDDDDDALAAARAEEGELDELLVLEAVQDEEALARLLHRERAVELGLRPGLEPEVVARALAEVLLDDRPVLVDLHRVDAHVRALVLVLADGVAEGALEFSDLPRDELREAQEHGRLDTAAAQVVDDLAHVGGAVLVGFRRVDDEVAFAIDAEVTGPPVLYAVGLKRLFDGRGQLLGLLPPCGFAHLDKVSGGQPPRGLSCGLKQLDWTCLMAQFNRKGGGRSKTIFFGPDTYASELNGARERFILRAGSRLRRAPKRRAEQALDGGRGGAAIMPAF